MTALLVDTDIPEMDSAHAFEHERGVAANAVIFQGSMVVIDAAGFIDVAITATTLVGAGLATRAVDNTGGANGDLNCRFRSGVFRFENDVGAPVVAADIGGLAFAVDDNTIANVAGGTLSSVGTIQQLDADGGVWVAMHFVQPPPAV